MAICRYHPGEEALYECNQCRTPICPLCLVMFGRNAFCKRCAKERGTKIPKIHAADVGIRTREARPSEVMAFAAKFILPPVALLLIVGGGILASRIASGKISFSWGEGATAVANVWIMEGEQRYGPYTGATVRRMRERGEISDETLVSIAGGAYRTYRDVAAELPAAEEEK